MTTPIRVEYPLFRVLDNDGFVSGAQLFVYEAGTSTKKNSYPTAADAIAGTNANSNPVVMDSRGEDTIYVMGECKLVLAPSTDTDPPTDAIWTFDNYGADENALYNTTLGDNLYLDDYSIVYNSDINTTEYVGEIEEGATLGETVVFGQALYWDISEQKWKLADADSLTTMGRLGLALGSGGDTDTINILTKGYVSYNSWAWTTDDSVKFLYVGTTAGEVTETAVSGAGDISQILGYIISATKIFFDPGISYAQEGA